MRLCDAASVLATRSGRSRVSFGGVQRTRPAIRLILAIVLIGGCGGLTTPPKKSTPRTVGSAPNRASTRTSFVRNAVPQPDWRPYHGAVPILVYHQLGTPPAAAPYPGLYTSHAVFEREMAWLHEQGYQAVTLDEMINAWHHGGTLPSKPIVITFDDGVLPQATYAPSVLSRYGWPGVLNEVVENHLSNARLLKLIKIGWEIDSHSLTHPDLRTLAPSALEREVAGSRAIFRRTLGVGVNSFCYPASKYDATVVAAVKAAGYTTATTENPGYATPNTNPLLLPRFEMQGGLSQLQADLGQPH